LDIGDVGVEITGVACLNEDCRKLSLVAALRRWDNRAIANLLGSVLHEWRLMPESNAIPQPDYIPASLLQDYYEACRIRDLSAKASATLARRCLQGMIRDFCKIARGTLDAEIKELRAQLERGTVPPGVTPESIDAIDHIRSVGNIGAHMEKDVNLIIDIDPGEAQALIELIEMLFVEWYVARKQREERLARVAAIGKQKKQERAANKTQTPTTDQDSSAEGQ
jgi:hypothetical protein